MVDGDDPFKARDVTVVRPRPGAGKRGSSDTIAAQPFTFPAPAPQQASAASRDTLAIGLNPLVQAASPLLRLAGQVRSVRGPVDIAALQRQARDDLRAFETRALAAGVPREIVLPARYVLCATVDEAVMSTPGGAQSEWSQQSLLVEMHREAYGGEKFFEMLDRVSRDPARYIDLMELLYVCLALGFMGKYHMMDRGYEHLADVRADLYRTITRERGKKADELSLRWRGLEDRRNPLFRYVPWWVGGVAVLAILITAFAVYQSRLAALAVPVREALARTDLQAPPLVAPLPSAPTLKQLLADDERGGSLRVDENGGVTTVTLLAADLFASGSADVVNPAHVETLRRVAQALNRVEGSVRVEGHTDDQPLRSSRYVDNFELSRARAIGVVEVLKGSIDSPARLRAFGKGPSTTFPERSRNRRVEIIHLSGT